MQLNAREILQADQERLMTIVHEAEMQKLTRKYKLSAIIEQVRSISNGVDVWYLSNEQCTALFQTSL